MDGTIFDIQRFCLHDGPGIRTVVFLKGCPLRCRWCHNPESRRGEPEILFSPFLCIDCGRCDEVCPRGSARRTLSGRADDPAVCEGCARCAAVCPGGAIRQVGRTASVDEVFAEIEKDRVFYDESHGGWTLSGGEPMAQWPFVRALLERGRQLGLHACLETSGAGPAESFAEIATLVDLFLWDLKDTDPQRHLANTGMPLEPILASLERTAAAGGRIILRCLLIGGVNLDETHLRSVADLARRTPGIERIELLGYNPLAPAKYEALGLPVPEGFEPPGDEKLEEARGFLSKRAAVPCVVR